jgi:prepilin-type N-terminal cleavage/methylation domain-containing protein
MFIKVSQQDEQGFTLIEILVTIIIIGVMASLFIPNFLNWYNNQKINNVLSQIEGAVKEARSIAVKKSQTCDVIIAANGVSASPASCLPTGARNISGVNANISTEQSGSATPGSTTITFSTRGTTSIVAGKSVIVVYDRDAQTSRKMKCLVVSDGIGITRIGNYTGTTPPTSTDNVDTVESQCVTPS